MLKWKSRQNNLSVKQSSFKTVSFDLRSFHDRQHFCFPRAELHVRSMNEKEKMKSYLVEVINKMNFEKKKLLKEKIMEKILQKNLSILAGFW